MIKLHSFRVMIFLAPLAGFSFIVACNTPKKTTLTWFEKMEPLRKSGKAPFYGVWTDYFSSRLKINVDSSFTFSWGYNLKGNLTIGKWTIVKDTFYFRKSLLYDTLRYIGADNISAHPMPGKLCYFKNKLFLIDSNGELVKGKIPSPYMGKKSPMFKTLYFREKRFNLDYFDSGYYKSATERRFKMGIGPNVILQSVSGYRIVASVGFEISPRYIFERKRNSYLSLGLPLATGFSRFDDSMSIDLKLGPMINAPLIFNYNYSFGSVEDGGSRFGYFAGGGFAYHYNHYTAAKDNATITQTVTGFVPVANAGMRYSLRKYRLQNFELKLSYMKMMSGSRPDIFGISFIVNF